MIDTMDFTALSDTEGAAIVGGENWVKFVLTYLFNNAGAFAEGVQAGYAAGRT